MKQPWEKLGMSEMVYLMCYTSGYNDAYRLHAKCAHKPGTAASKAYHKGKRDAKKY
jgi:hypothetical protein